MTRRGRPKASAPRGRVTLEQAAELSGVSYWVAHRRVAEGAVPSQRDPSGVVTLARRDVKLIRPREPGDGDGRKAVMLRPDLERYAAWKRAAGDLPVSTWLGELADRAAEQFGDDAEPNTEASSAAAEDDGRRFIRRLQQEQRARRRRGTP